MQVFSRPINFIRSIPAFAADHKKVSRRPFVTLSYAQSLDGCISSRPGESLALSGRQSLTLTHQLRAIHDAILVGIGTVLSDNPRLNVRLVNGRNPQPVIVDTHLRIPLECRLLAQESVNPWIMCAEGCDATKRRVLEKTGAQLVVLTTNSKGQIDLASMLDKLGELGVGSIMVEGGARIITSFLLERLPNYLVLTVAPVMVGGLRAVSDLGPCDPDNFLRIKNPGHKWLGQDLILWGDLS
jgi:riboflavin-specific deaminase-like protein